MVQSQGTVTNLNEGGQESMRALIQALVPEASLNSEGRFSGDVVEKLSERFSQLVGPQGIESSTEIRNERGELVNEEGLLIIDINEPVSLTNKLQSPGSIPPLATVEPLLPLATLPSPVRDRLRERRNLILDALEKEEEEDQLQEAQREDEEIQQRAEEAKKAKERREKAQELQRKMGRALLQNIEMDRKREEQEKEAQRIQDEEADKRRSPSIKKKTVAFADQAEIAGKEPKDSSLSDDWGDVTPARLRSTKRPTLLSQALLDKHPMKMSVVERIPGGQPTMLKQPDRSTHQSADSDDESDQENCIDNDDTDTDLEPSLDEDAVDLDYAQHQREIALQYYQKRNTIGQVAAAAMMNHSHDANDIPVHNTDTDIISETDKPGISKFKATRIASAYGASITTSVDTSATSLAESVLPASSARTIQRAIRTGKLDGSGNLVGGDDDSASEKEDQGLQEVLELLRKGEVYNLGPDGNYVHAVRPNTGSSLGRDGTASTSSAHATVSPKAPAVPPPNARPKTSKFKASLAAAGRPSPSTSSVSPTPSTPNIISPSVTPVSNAGRSSPKRATPPPVSFVPERQGPSVKSPLPSAQAVPAFSVIVDSPSFPRPQGQPFVQTTNAQQPMVISSPSFPPPTGSRRLTRPPQVLAMHVTESRSGTSHATNEESVEPTAKKPSRFKAERM